MIPLSVRIHVLILHWGDPKITAACLRSMQSVTTPDMEVVVIDNGTPDRGGRILERQFPEFTHIRSETNLGFAAGNNLGLRRAIEHGADFALLLNNDTEVEPQFLEPMLDEMRLLPNTGLINPKILYAEPKGKIWSSHCEHSLWTGVTRFIDRYQPDVASDINSLEMTFATGCALLISRAVLETVGLLDDGLFMYAEDLDYSIRVRTAGFKIRNVRASRIIHHEPVQRKKTVPDPFRLHLTTRNLVKVELRHAKPWHHLTFWPWFLLRWMLYLSLKNIRLGFWGDAAAMWRGLWDGITGKTGLPEVALQAKATGGKSST